MSKSLKDTDTGLIYIFGEKTIEVFTPEFRYYESISADNEFSSLPDFPFSVDVDKRGS